MAANEAGDLSTRIRREVAGGKAREDIVTGLLERGLTRPSAERFVDRAMAARDAGPPPPPAASPASDADDEDDSGGRGSLISGAFWLSFGCSVTGITYLFAKPGERYMLAYGAVLAGLIAFVRGLNRFRDGSPAPFPWKAVLVAGIVPVIGIGGLATLVRQNEARKRAAVHEAAEAERKAVQEARDTETRAVAERARVRQATVAAEAAAEAHRQRQAAHVEKFLGPLRDPDAPLTRVCDAAQALGRMGVREAIPHLQTRLADPASPNTQWCMAQALTAMGEVETALAFYVGNASSTNDDLRRIGITGFGMIGPRAAGAGFPYLVAEMQSPDSTRRNLAVWSLAKMGREAAPLLRDGLNDADPQVKQRSTDALAAMGER